MAKILLVDDETPNRALIRAYMARSGHQLVDASSGAMALELAAADPPDLVLLDVLMPEMDGFEVAARLKAAPASSSVPIILVTALSDLDSRRRGFEAGADDFLTKPVDPQELTLRVRNLLALREHQRALTQRNHELVELQRFKDELIGLVVHDFRSPLAVLQAGIDYVLSTPELDGEAREALEDARFSTRRLLDLVGNLVETRRLEEAQLPLQKTRVAVTAWLSTLVSARSWDARDRGVTIECQIADLGEMRFDRGLITRAVDNLVDYAIRHAPRGGRAVVEARPAPGGFEIRVGNSGAGIPPEMLDRVFEKYGRTAATGGGEPRSMSVGLGLYVCRLVVEAHGGRVWLEDGPELPTVFAVALPDEPNPVLVQTNPEQVASRNE